MNTIVITRTLKTGQAVELGLTAVGNEWHIEARVDGKTIDTLRPNRIAALRPKHPMQPEYTHSIGKLALKAGELDQLVDAIAEAGTAQGEPAQVSLDEQRRRLVAAIRGHDDEVEYQRERAFELGTGAPPQYETPRRAEMVAALETFDAAHPEILAAIKAEKAERTQRFLAND